MIGMILLRTVHRDIARYNRIVDNMTEVKKNLIRLIIPFLLFLIQDDTQEEFGWKL